MRRKTFGSDLTMSLSRLACLPAVPARVLRSRPVAALENAAADYACLLNDVFSYQKEIQFEGEIHNGVLVTQNFLGCGAAPAMRVVGDLMAARMRLFQHVLAEELPVLLDTANLDRAAREALWSHARNLQDWLAGILNWHRGCHRYAEADLIAGARPALPRLFRAPAGLGTSAARVTRAPGDLTQRGFRAGDHPLPVGS
jgi:germacradienol/geosmin synthase